MILEESQVCAFSRVILGRRNERLSLNELLQRPTKPGKSWDWTWRSPPRRLLPWRSTWTTLLRLGCRISAHPGTAARNSAASNSRPAVAGNNCRRTAADTADTADRRQLGRCCSPSTSRTARKSTTRRSSRAHSGCDKAPNGGAYPPVRPGCSPRPCLCTRCRRYSSRDGAAYHRQPSSAAAAVAAVAANCCARCCSCTGTGWRGFRCPRTTTAMPSRF